MPLDMPDSFLLLFQYKPRKLPHDAGQQQGGLGIGSNLPHIGQGRAGKPTRYGRGDAIELSESKITYFRF